MEASVLELELFGELAVIGALTVATTLGLHRFGLPATAGFLVTGAVAGPHGLGLVGDEGHIELIAEIGVILLLFAVGLEFSLSRLRFIWKSVAFGGSLQVGITTLAVLGILIAFGETLERGDVFGLAAALSSTVVVLRVLADRDELNAPHGRFGVGLIGSAELRVVVTTGVVSIVVSRLLMHWTGGLHAGETQLRPLERLLRARGIDEPTAEDSHLTDHVVIAGYGVAERDELLRLGADLVVCEEVEGGTEMTAHVLKSLGLDAPTIRSQISHALASSQAANLTGAMEEWLEATDKQP